MRVKFALLLCVFVLSFLRLEAHAESVISEKVWVDKSRHELTRYFTLHREEDRWWLESFEVHEGELQRFVSRKGFDRPEDAISEVQKQIPEAMEVATQLSNVSAIPSKTATEVPGRVIWKVENEWDWNWEVRYSDWVRENIKADFFQKYQIGVDCADVAFSARWIFARIHHLPAADTLAGTGTLFTQDAMLKEWENLPQGENWNDDPLFIASLKYLLNNTYTHTLMRDSYPIRITKEAFLPGTQHLSLTPESGHTYVVSAVDLSENSADPIRVIYSTVPAEARRLLESGFWDVPQPVMGKGGFVRFRWPEKVGDQWMLKSADQMFFYSTEQYERTMMEGFGSFAEAVAIKLNPHLDFKARLQNAINTVIERIKMRASIVEKGEKICAAQDCSEGTANYENWSTPSRDQSLGETIRSLEEYADRMSDRIPGLSEIWYKSLETPVLRLDDVEYSLGAVAYAWKVGSFSSDPKQPIAVRWGLSGESFRNFMRAQLKKWMDERATKISSQGTTCLATDQSSSACNLSTPEWQTWQTFDLDNKIQTLALGSASYCDYAPKSECDRFEKSLDIDSMSVDNQRRTLRDWIEISPWLNSDPRRNQDERWGSLKEKYFHHLTYPGDVLNISKTGWMLSRTSEEESSPTLKNLFSGKEVRAPKGFRFTVLDLESGLALAEKSANTDKDILVIRPDDRTTRMRQRVSVKVRSVWISASRLVLADDHSVQIFDCSQTPCLSQVAQPISRRPKLIDLMIPEVFLVQDNTGSYVILDARARQLQRYAFEWNKSERYLPEGISFETRDYFGGMAAMNGAGEGVDRQQFFVRKSDGKVLKPSYSHGTEYLRYFSWNGNWGVLAQLYESDDEMALVELDANLKVKSRQVFGNAVANTSQNCRDLKSIYFLAKDAQSKVQYFRLSDLGLTKAPLLSDEIEAKAGCREEMILKTGTGDRLRKWGSPTALIESSGMKFLPPQPEGGQIRWLISSPSKNFQQSELIDLRSLAGGPVLTGSLSLLEELNDPNPTSIRSGHVISVGQDRLLWFWP
jgi:hypothetical protein